MGAFALAKGRAADVSSTLNNYQLGEPVDRGTLAGVTEHA